MMQESQPHLLLRFSVERPLFDASQIDALHRLINEFLPSWSAQLSVSRGEEQYGYPSLCVGRDGSLFMALHKVSPPRGGIGRAVFSGAYKGVSFFIGSCHSTLPPELNHLSIEILGLSSVEGEPLASWAWKLFENLPQQLRVRYGNAHLDEEFRAKNMIEDETGMRAEAIGVKLDYYLPGLYWLNYFGNPYLKLIGEDRLLSAPAFAAREVGNGVLIVLDESPANWQSAAYKEREIAILSHIGRDYFFLRNDPDRQFIAPNFQEL